MSVCVGVLSLVRSLSATREERRRLSAAVIALIRQRRFSLALFGPSLARLPTAGRAKLQLWKCIAATYRLTGSKVALDDDVQATLLEAIKQTSAYRNAELRLSYDRNGFLQRGFNYQQLLRRLSEEAPQRIFIFHHHDRRGLLPRSWQIVLSKLCSNGWQVILSTSFIDSLIIERLESVGVHVALRSNRGLCLGAYRDLVILMSSLKACSRPRSLVLANDSNLLVKSPEVLIDQLEGWVVADEASHRPTMAGLTDSAQRNCYHLQSYFLYINSALLYHPAWLRFWLRFSIAGSKDDLINDGEIGLSQALLSEGVILKPAYSLVKGLLVDPAMSKELQGYGISQPEHINQSLFAWQSLLDRGFPLVKKHVLFQLVEQQGKQLAISQLATRIPSDLLALIAEDIEQLMISRFSGNSPRMG